MACFACVVFILLQRPKICWLQCSCDTCVVITSQFNNSFLSTSLCNLWIHEYIYPAIIWNLNSYLKITPKINKHMKQVRIIPKSENWEDEYEIITGWAQEIVLVTELPILVIKLFITLCKEAAYEICTWGFISFLFYAQHSISAYNAIKCRKLLPIRDIKIQGFFLWSSLLKRKMHCTCISTEEGDQKNYI